MATRKMHQTTVRFGPDLWEALEQECALLGVSVAQYIRESALTRLVYAAGRRGDDEFELALELATGSDAETAPEPPGRGDPPPKPSQAQEAHARALDEQSQAAALVAQGELARARSRRPVSYTHLTLPTILRV